jgi:hypothetical protein
MLCTSLIGMWHGLYNNQQPSLGCRHWIAGDLEVIADIWFFSVDVRRQTPRSAVEIALSIVAFNPD